MLLNVLLLLFLLFFHFIFVINSNLMLNSEFYCSLNFNPLQPPENDLLTSNRLVQQFIVLLIVAYDKLTFGAIFCTLERLRIVASANCRLLRYFASGLELRQAA